MVLGMWWGLHWVLNSTENRSKHCWWMWDFLLLMDDFRYATEIDENITLLWNFWMGTRNDGIYRGWWNHNSSFFFLICDFVRDHENCSVITSTLLVVRPEHKYLQPHMYATQLSLSSHIQWHWCISKDVHMHMHLLRCKSARKLN